MTINTIIDEFKSIDKLKITEIKAHANPPRIIAYVLESVLILLRKEPTITQTRRLLADPHLIEILQNFDVQSVDSTTLKKLKIFTSMESFNYESVLTVSQPIACLLKWVKEVEKMADHQLK
ncbi:dynein heavy chain axonemal [Brachionus plicatilis]|uniref:Dynein heavy chain axonemal n=1 Tax=Brachionus plicatilis TaxID=10195 RepID=A0A3M7RNT5_BRAPC|nr:dynein heavy chain axonemal [Brachionus plicatilis]